MKKLILIFAVVFTTLFGCQESNNIVHDVSEIVVIDSTGLYEDVYNPGLFLVSYDTLVLVIDSEYNTDTKGGKVVYSARHK